jgi:hypothetical protein
MEISRTVVGLRRNDDSVGRRSAPIREGEREAAQRIIEAIQMDSGLRRNDERRAWRLCRHCRRERCLVSASDLHGRRSAQDRRRLFGSYEPFCNQLIRNPREPCDCGIRNCKRQPQPTGRAQPQCHSCDSADRNCKHIGPAQPSMQGNKTGSQPTVHLQSTHNDRDTG